MLNVTKINSGYGGSKLETNPTNIKQGVGYLVPHDQILEVEDHQYMVFQ